MADRYIHELPELAATPAQDDELIVSVTSEPNPNARTRRLKVRHLPSGGPGPTPVEATVETDDTLTGSGQPSSPLSVAFPFSQALLDTLNGKADTATVNNLFEMGLDFVDLQINNDSILTTTLNSQRTSDRPLWIFFTADVAHTVGPNTTTYTHGTIAYIRPRSDVINVWLDLNAMIAALGYTHSSTEIADGSITTAKLANQAVTDRKIAPESIRSSHFPGTSQSPSPTIQAKDIGRNQVTGEKIAANSINNGHMLDNAINTPELADNAVTREKLAQAVRDAIDSGGGGGMGGVDQTARDAAAAARGVADANKAFIDRLAVFGQYELNPAGIPAGVPPDFIALTLSTKRVNKVIDRLQVNLGGVIMFDARRIARPVPPATDPLAPFNFASNDYEASGGVINLAFPNPADKQNFTNAAMGTVAMRNQFVHGLINYTFTDGTTATDRIHFGVNNNAFRSPAGLDQAAVDARVQAAKGTATPTNTPGTASAGTASKWAPEDHDHGISPGTGGGGGLNQNQVDARVRAIALQLVGGTLTGALTLSGDPSANLQAATKQYVDNLLADIDSNFIVDNPTSPIAPTDDNADKILVRGGRLYENILHSATNPIVSYRDFTQADWRTAVGDTAAEWGGAVQVTSPANQHPANYGLYSIPGAHFLRRIGSGFPANYGEFTPANWRGPAPNKDRADEQVTAIGDITYYAGSVRVVTAFTAGTTRHRTWEPIVAPPAEHSVTRESLADSLLATTAEMNAGTADKLTTADIVKAFVEAYLPDLRTLIATNAVPAAADRFFFTDENQTNDPLRYSTWFQLASSIVTDDRVLDLAQSSRAAADRGKFLGLATDNENNLVLLDAPGGLNQSQVDARIATYARATPSGTIPLAQIPADIARTSQLRPTVQTLTSAAAITWAIGRGDQADLTLAHNTTLTISGGVDGDAAVLAVTQDGTGSRTLALHSSISRGGRAAPVLSTGARETDYLAFIRRGGTWRYLSIIKHG